MNIWSHIIASIHHTPQDHTYSGIIVLVNKQYDILHSVIKIPGRLLNLHLRHNATKHTYNLTVYYAHQVKQLHKPEMVSVVQAFSQVHDVSQNNIIIGDSNFADNDTDRDHMMTSIWEGFTSAMALRDPFRTHYPKMRIYSFVHTTGKSRGGGYVNDENVPNISEHKYTLTPFNLAHKILSLTITDQQERGRGYWKLNSSVLNDKVYIAMVRQTSANVGKLPIRDPQKWWDTFLTSVRSKTVAYTKRKHSIENECRSRLREDLLRLEAVPTDQLTLLQAARYAFLKEKLKTFEEKLIEGYRHCTRGLPRYE